MPLLRKSRSRRPSPSRRAVIEAVEAFDHPFTLREILAVAQGRTAGLGRSAVYRTITWLEAEARIKRLATPSGRIVFTTRDSQVTCVVECPACGAIRQVNDTSLADHAKSLATRAGFALATAHWTVTATCPHHGENFTQPQATLA